MEPYVNSIIKGISFYASFKKRRSDKRIGPVRNDVYDDKDEANTLNSFFTTEGKNLASKFTPPSGSPLSFIHRITPTIDLYDEIPPTKCQLSKGTWFRQYYVERDESGQCRV